MTAHAARFHELHRSGIFVMPNPWDVGSAMRLESMGFEALATTSSGHAASIGKHDREVVLDELIEHVGRMCRAVDVPVSVDLEWGYVDDAAELDSVVDALSAAGAAGFSLEDYHPREQAIVSRARATERVAAGVESANARGLVLTARAENHIHGHDDLDDTIERLQGFVEAGAHAVFAPGVRSVDGIQRIVALGAPVNVLALPGTPTVAELGELGVRRISTGGALAHVAYNAAEVAAAELRDQGTAGYFARM